MHGVVLLFDWSDSPFLCSTFYFLQNLFTFSHSGTCALLTKSTPGFWGTHCTDELFIVLPVKFMLLASFLDAFLYFSVNGKQGVIKKTSKHYAFSFSSDVVLNRAC